MPEGPLGAPRPAATSRIVIFAHLDETPVVPRDSTVKDKIKHNIAKQVEVTIKQGKGRDYSIEMATQGNIATLKIVEMFLDIIEEETTVRPDSNSVIIKAE